MPPIPLSRDVTARGIRTRVVEIGSGPPLVLLHGFLCSHRSFDEILEPLADKFRVVAIDLPGFGDSEKPPPSRYPYSPETFAEIVADVIAALHLGRCHVLGHALGGTVAITLAAEHPELVDRLVLIAPHVFPSTLSLHTRLLTLPVLGSLLFKQAFGRRLFHRFFQQRVYAAGHNVPTERIDAFFDAFNAPTAREAAHSVIRALLDTRPAVARLSRLKSPTLVVWGRADSLFPPQDGPKLCRQIPNAHLEFIDSGHCPHEEQPERFFEHVQRFLLGQRP